MGESQKFIILYRSYRFSLVQFRLFAIHFYKICSGSFTWKLAPNLRGLPSLATLIKAPEKIHHWRSSEKALWWPFGDEGEGFLPARGDMLPAGVLPPTVLARDLKFLDKKHQNKRRRSRSCPGILRISIIGTVTMLLR